MSATQKFNAFTEDVGRGVHNLNADTLKVMLSNVPPVATNAVFADLTDISSGHGYTAAGTAAGSNAFTQTAGVAKLTASSVTFTASGGTIGPFQFAVLYNDTAGSKNLICWWDFGVPVTLADGQSFTVAFNAGTGIITLT